MNVDPTLGAVTGDLGAPNVRNSIIWSNGLDGIDLYFANADYSTFGSNEFVTSGVHNLSVDPILVNMLFGNYRLQMISPVIGAGATLPIEQRDFYGNPRPVTGRFDIGANQYKDSLGDGIQDDWKIKHGLSLTVSQASLDFDGDGLNNLQEYNNNTDPHNPDTDRDGISDGPIAPPGSGLQPGPDPNPTTPEVIWNTEFWDYFFESQFETYIDGVPSPQWINEPVTRPRAVVLTNKHIGDHVNLQWQYIGGTGFEPFLVFYVPQTTGGSIIPDLNAVPLNQIQVGDNGYAPPAGPWGSTISRVTLTNDPCGGFDDETPKYVNFTHDALSVPQNGTNTVTAVVFPTNVFSQISFDKSDSFISVSPSQASSVTQLVSVSGFTSGNSITSSTFRVLGIGAQNSYTTVCATADIDVLPRGTNVTVAIYAVTATGEPYTAPANAPTQAGLKSYLDTVYGKQANVFITVLPLVNITANYDLNMNSNMDLATGNFLSAEMKAVTNAAYTSGAINVYYVKSIECPCPTEVLGITFPPLGVIFIQDSHPQSNVNLTAHELGHALGLTPDDVQENTWGSDERLMLGYGSPNNPCRLVRFEWQTVNKTARGASQ